MFPNIGPPSRQSSPLFPQANQAKYPSPVPEQSHGSFSPSRDGHRPKSDTSPLQRGSMAWTRTNPRPLDTEAEMTIAPISHVAITPERHRQGPPSEEADGDDDGGREWISGGLAVLTLRLVHIQTLNSPLDCSRCSIRHR
jgi:hypothetical protein